jgi:hypothetical protein
MIEEELDEVSQAVPFPLVVRKLRDADLIRVPMIRKRRLPSQTSEGKAKEGNQHEQVKTEADAQAAGHVGPPHDRG